MKILKYKKTSRGRYKVTLDSDEIILYEDVIIKNDFLLRKNVDTFLLDKVLNENVLYEAYDLALGYIETKLRTEKEIIKYLEKKGYSTNTISDVLNRLKSNNLINEVKYVEAYTNDKINLSSYGPFKIKRDLSELGISENVIDNYLDKIDDEVWSNKLDKIIDKKVKLMKNKSLFMIKNKLKGDLALLGFDKDMINYKLNSLDKSDEDSLKKEMEKAYNKYSKKYEGEALKRQIKNHLYKKGFITSDAEI